MLVSKFSAAFAAVFAVAPCALAQAETRWPEIGVGAPRAGAQAYAPLVDATGPKKAQPVRGPAASAVVIPNQTLRAHRAFSCRLSKE
jgi:hypothetical protein